MTVKLPVMGSLIACMTWLSVALAAGQNETPFNPTPFDEVGAKGRILTQSCRCAAFNQEDTRMCSKETRELTSRAMTLVREIELYKTESEKARRTIQGQLENIRQGSVSRDLKGAQDRVGAGKEKVMAARAKFDESARKIDDRIQKFLMEGHASGAMTPQNQAKRARQEKCYANYQTQISNFTAHVNFACGNYCWEGL